MRLAYITPFGQITTRFCANLKLKLSVAGSHANFMCSKSHSVKFRSPHHTTLAVYAFAILFGFLLFIFFSISIFVLNAGHAIDRLQPINKLNARIECILRSTCLRLSECRCYAIVSQLTKYGITHLVSERSLLVHFIHVCRETFFSDLFLHIMYSLFVFRMSDNVCRPPRQWRDVTFRLH